MEHVTTNAEHTALRERLDQYVDGSLPAAERRPLEAHLASCVECRRERESLEELHGLLERSRVAADPELARRVMTAVAEQRPAVARPLSLAAGLVGGLLLLSAVLFGLSSADLGGFDLLAAMADFAGSTMLVGAGLLAASWRGVGMVVEEWILASIPNLLVTLLLLVAVNALALRLVRSRRVAATRAERATDRS